MSRTSSLVRRASRVVGYVSLALVAACAPPDGPTEPPLDPDDPPRDRPSADVEVRVDDREVACARVSYLGVVADARVRVRSNRGDLDAVEVRLGGRPVSVDSRSGTLEASLELAHEPQALTVERAGRELCRAYVRSDAADAAARARLLASSEGPTRVTRSWRTGNAGNLTGTFPLPAAATPREAVEAFVSEHADVFGVVPTQLVWQEERDGADAWQTHRFRQTLEDRPVLGAALEVVVDRAGRVRGLHSTLLPALVDAPVTTRSGERVAASVGATALPGVVLYTELSTLGTGSPALRAGWEAQTVDETLLVDDATGEVRVREENQVSLTLAALDGNDGNRIVEGDPRNPPNICVGPPTPGSGCDFNVTQPVATAWANYADILRWARSRSYRGVVPAGYSCPEECGDTPVERLTSCGCITHDGPDYAQFTVLNGFADLATYQGVSQNLMRLDRRIVSEIDVICHEHAHGIDFGAHGNVLGSVSPNPRTTIEAAADLFAIGCEMFVAPSRDEWVIGDSLTIRDIRRRARAGVDYDTLVPTSERNLNLDVGAAYAATFVMTAAVHEAVVTHGWDMSRGYEAFAYESLVWQRPDYPTWRDRWLTTAALWAEDGRHGLTQEDVCAMARGFRDTGLHAIPDTFGPGDREWDDVCDQAGSEEEQCWCRPADPCAEAMDCAACNGRSECGWCEAELGCIARDRIAECEMQGGTWTDRITECVDCASRSTCGECVDRNAFCGWCPGVGCVDDSAVAATACGTDYRRVIDGCE